MAEGLTYEVFYCAKCTGIAEPFYTLNKLQEHMSGVHGAPLPELPFKAEVPLQSNGAAHGIAKAGARSHAD